MFHEKIPTNIFPPHYRIANIKFCFGFVSVVFRNHLTTHLNIDVSKPTNRKIERIIKQWQKEKPIVEIAQYFALTRQRIYQFIAHSKTFSNIPTSNTLEEKRESLIANRTTDSRILSSNNLSPTYLEKKIQESHEIHSPNNRIYRGLVFHGQGEININKQQHRNESNTNVTILCHCGRGIS